MPDEDCHKRTYEGYFNYWNETQCDRFSYDLSKEKKVKNHVMCAQNPRTGLGQTTCIGDSGGPLTVKLKSGKHVLVGVAADGYSCGVVSFVQNPEKCGKHFLQITADHFNPMCFHCTIKHFLA